jgi:citrate lyase subunit beta-like protein
VTWAREVVAAFEEHQKSGKGAFSYRNTMIDMPTVKQAENIIKTIDRH